MTNSLPLDCRVPEGQAPQISMHVGQVSIFVYSSSITVQCEPGQVTMAMGADSSLVVNAGSNAAVDHGALQQCKCMCEHESGSDTETETETDLAPSSHEPAGRLDPATEQLETKVDMMRDDLEDLYNMQGRLDKSVERHAARQDQVSAEIREIKNAQESMRLSLEETKTLVTKALEHREQVFGLEPAEATPVATIPVSSLAPPANG